MYGRDTAVVDPERTLTFSELDGHSNALAHALVNHGIGQGSVVGVLARNHAGFLEAAAGVAKTGADLLLLNTEMAAPQLRDVSAREHATLVIHDDDLADRLEGEASVGAVPMSRVTEIANKHTTAALPTVAPGRTIILTSGTTGTPKGAERDVVPRQLATAIAALGLFDTIPYRGGDTMLVAAPLFHAWGYAHATIGLTLGCTTVLRPRFDGAATIATIADRRAPRVGGGSCDAHAPARGARIGARRARHHIAATRAALGLGPAERARPHIHGRLRRCALQPLRLHGGGLGDDRDTCRSPCRARHRRKGHPRRRPAHRRRRRPRALTGERGHIAVHSPLAFEHYTDGTSRRAVDGYMLTGDTGHLDDAGRLFVDGRDDDMIVSGGENVYPSEVEHLLEAHPDVADVAVVGVDDPEFGARLHAYVVRAPDGADLDADGVRDYVPRAPRPLQGAASTSRSSTRSPQRGRQGREARASDTVSPTILAVDIGGSKLAAGAVTSDGELLHRATTPTPRTDDADVLWRGARATGGRRDHGRSGLRVEPRRGRRGLRRPDGARR